MPKTFTKTINISNFYGGIAETDLDIYSRPGEAEYVQSADLFRSKEFLRPQFDMVDDKNGTAFDQPTQGESGQVRGYVKRSGSNNIYAIQFGNDTDPSSIWRSQLITKSSLTGTWTVVDTEANDDGAGEPVFGIWEVDGNLYWIHKKTTAGAAGYLISQYALGSSTFTEDWDNLNVSAWGSPTVATAATKGGALLHTDGNLYFWIGRYIGPYDGTSKPSTITPFALPSNYTIVDAISYGHYILCAANDGSASTVTGAARTSKLFLLDPYSNVGIYTFDDIYDTGTYEIQALALVEGGVKVITALYDYYIWDWSGGNTFIKEKRINVLVTGSTTQFSVRRTAVDVRDNILYMGMNNSISGFRNGIYAYGRDRIEDPKIVHNAYVNHVDDISVIDYRAVKWITDAGNTVLHASFYDDDAAIYEMSRSSTARDIANFKYESVFFRPWRNMKSQCIQATFYHDELGASDRFQLRWKVDDSDDAYTEIDTSIGTTGAVETVLTNNMAGLTNNFPKGFRHKFEYIITGGEVRIEGIKLKFRTVSQE